MNRDITTFPPVPASERIRYGKEPSQFFDLFHTDKPVRGSAMMIHGGFWRARYDLQHASHLCAALAGQGIVVANLEYRRVGEPGGGWPGTYEDVLAGFDSVLKFLGEPLAVLGHSAGGHLALRLAADRKPAGIIALAPVADLIQACKLNLSDGAVIEFLGDTPENAPDSYRNADAKTHSSAVRRFLIHGEEDDVVPISLSFSYLEARSADRPDVVLAKLSLADHFDLIDPETTSGAWETVRLTVHACLGKPV
ncbi:MAG: alpha/beta hydrolase family protein [Acidobacteriaceae bacterium]